MIDELIGEIKDIVNARSKTTFFDIEKVIKSYFKDKIIVDKKERPNNIARCPNCGSKNWCDTRGDCPDCGSGVC